MSSKFDIVVVGGGIAGLTAGLTAARLGRSTLVVTGDTLGGHLLNIEKIDGYPGFPDGVPGYDLCPMAQEQAMAAGAETTMTSLTALEARGDTWSVTTPGDSYEARCVIVATGTRLRELGVPGEEKLRGRGVSQCASCDAPLLRDQAAIVAGGGDSALQEALVLGEHCSSVTLVHHGAAFTAQASYVALATANPKITALANSEIAGILGDGSVAGVQVRELSSGATTDIACAAVFGFIGLEPNAGFLDKALLDGAGYVVTDTALRTAHAGLLAAGTVRSGSAGRAAAAAGEGAAAALSAHRYLAGDGWLARG